MKRSQLFVLVAFASLLLATLLSAAAVQAAPPHQGEGGTARPYWLLLDPSRPAEVTLPPLLKALAHLRAAGVVRRFDQAAQDGALHVVAGPNSAAKLRHLPGVAGLSSVPPAAVSALSGEVGILASGAITGVVTAEVGGALLSGIEACAYSSWWDEGVCATTGVSGTYSIGALDTGRYQVQFYDDSGTYGGEYYNNKTGHPGDAISVTEGSTTPNINAALAVAGHITGVVTAEDSGDGVSGVEVSVDTDLGDWYDFTDDGVYDIGGVSPGSYKVEFWDSYGYYATEYYNNKISSLTATPVVVTAGGVTPNINASLAEGGAISGWVTDQDYNELADIEVAAYRYDSIGWEVLDASYTSGGWYGISGLSAGSYKVEFYDPDGYYAPQYYDQKLGRGAANPVTVRAEDVAEDIDGVLYAGGHITGTVTGPDGSTPLGGIEVVAYRYNNGGWDWIEYTYTDSAGQYDITLPSGTYRIGFEDWWWGEYLSSIYRDSATGATSVDLTAPNIVPNIDASLNLPSAWIYLPIIRR